MPAVLDAYIRVSEVGDRDEIIRSPRDQEDAIREWIEDHPDVELGRLVTELNVSGGTDIQERGLGELVTRIERGASQGVIVFDTSRFGRNLRETLNANYLIEQVGGRIVGVDNGLDTQELGGYEQLVREATEAEKYLRAIKRRWQRTTNRRVAEGKHTGHVPIGYMRREDVEPQYTSRGDLIRDGRLVIDEATAPLVLRAFQMQASGASHLEIAKEIDRKKAAVAHMLRNRIYLGEIRGSGGAINRSAHDPIVSEDLFAAVQARVGERAPRSDRKRKYEPLLNGLIRCADCGYLLQIVNTRRAGGENRPAYQCPSPSNNRP
jgi:site-specific DNA recombinase